MKLLPIEFRDKVIWEQMGVFEIMALFFNATPGGVFEQLSSIVGVFAKEVIQKGNAVTKIWELQRRKMELLASFMAAF